MIVVFVYIYFLLEPVRLAWNQCYSKTKDENAIIMTIWENVIILSKYFDICFTVEEKNQRNINQQNDLTGDQTRANCS